MMMKLVMVDPSKSGKDKVRSNTFHHFKNYQTEKNQEKHHANTENNTNVPIIFHKFEQNYSGSGTQIGEYEELSGFGEYRRDLDRSSKFTSKTKRNESTNISSNQSQQTNHENNINSSHLVIKIDPKYNTSTENTFAQLSRRHQGVSSNKIKKVTFMKTITKYPSLMYENSGIPSMLNEKIPTTGRHSDNSERKDEMQLVDNLQDIDVPQQKGIKTNSDSNLRYIGTETKAGSKNNKQSRTGKFNSDTKIKLNRSQLQPPVIKGYSTYTFKVNLKENKAEK